MPGFEYLVHWYQLEFMGFHKLSLYQEGEKKNPTDLNVPSSLSSSKSMKDTD